MGQFRRSHKRFFRFGTSTRCFTAGRLSISGVDAVVHHPHHCERTSGRYQDLVIALQRTDPEAQRPNHSELLQPLPPQHQHQHQQ